MNNELNTFIKYYERNFPNDTFCIWGINYKCLYTSKAYADIILQHREADIINKTMNEINEDLGELAKEIRPKVTDRVIRTKSEVSCYLMNRIAGSEDYSLYHLTLSPLINEHGELFALFNRTTRINFSEAGGKLISIITNPIIKKYHSINLEQITRKERIIVFLLIIGKSHKEIATIASQIEERQITSNSISAIVSRQIYPKFNVTNQSSLIITAIKSGCLSNIPHELVKHLPRVLLVY